MSDKKPLVSITCVTYNHAPYIEQCLQGFVMQKTDFDFEILVHDDASTDGTAAIIKRFEKEYPHLFKCIYQTENQWSKGIRPSQEFLWPKAQGKYIAVCEGDDYWTDPYKLQKQVDFLETHPGYSVCGTYCSVLRTDKLEEPPKESLQFGTFDVYDVISNNRIPTLTMVFNRTYWKGKIQSGETMLDVRLLLELTKTGKKIAKLPYNTAVYRYHGKGLNSGAKRDVNTLIHFNVKREFAKSYGNSIFTKKLKRYFFVMFLKELKLLFFHRNLFSSKILITTLRYAIKL